MVTPSGTGRKKGRGLTGLAIMAMARVWFICVLVAASSRGTAGRGAWAGWLGRRGGTARGAPDPIRRWDRSAAGRIVMRGNSVRSGRGGRGGCGDSVDPTLVCVGFPVGRIDMRGKVVLPGRGSVEFVWRWAEDMVAAVDCCVNDGKLCRYLAAFQSEIKKTSCPIPATSSWGSNGCQPVQTESLAAMKLHGRDGSMRCWADLMSVSTPLSRHQNIRQHHSDGCMSVGHSPHRVSG